MKTPSTLKIIAACACIYCSTSSLAQQHGHGSVPTQSAYAGEEGRDIKSLSAADVAGLQAGAGMGYAKAAELNGYPGPMHVLEFATQLKLSEVQRQATAKLMADHKARARLMGVQMVVAEQALDKAFASKSVDASSVTQLTQRIGELQASLRAEHLQTHLAQTAMLSAEQIANYQALRGYASALPSQKHAH